MQYKLNRPPKLFILFFLTLSLLLTTSTRPVYSHWSDLSVAEIVVNNLQTEVTLTFPTGLTKFADDNRDSQLQPAEVRSHQIQLEQFFSQQIRITNSSNIQGSVSVKPLEIAAKTASLIQQPNTHSTVILDYTLSQYSKTQTPNLPGSNLTSKNQLRINYNLFLPGVPTASCQATIVQAGAVKSFVFTPIYLGFRLEFAASSSGSICLGMRARDVARTRKNHSWRLFSRFAGYSPTRFISSSNNYNNSHCGRVCCRRNYFVCF